MAEMALSALRAVIRSMLPPSMSTVLSMTAQDNPDNGALPVFCNLGVFAPGECIELSAHLDGSPDELIGGLQDLLGVLAAIGAPLCERCDDFGRTELATDGRHCATCHDTLGEFQDERAAS